MVTIFDTETTTFKKGNPFSRCNRLCYAGLLREGGYKKLESELTPLTHDLLSATLLVGFNIKFDLHWLMRYGLSLRHIPLWDCQLAHFLLTNQTVRYPSLEEVCRFYGLAGKDDNIKLNYWDKGIDTPSIPKEEMLKYLEVDLERTLEVYHKQLEHFKDFPKLYTLFRIHCQDTHVLQEMEWNGLRLNVEQARLKADETRKRLDGIEATLQSKVAGGLTLNWDSVDDVSRFLYGGTITRENRVVVGVYLSGQKQGQPRYKIERVSYELPALTVPLKGSELAKEGYWSTDEKTLKQLKGVKPLVSLLLDRSRLSKLLDYYDGLPTLISDMDWDDSTLHGQLNQCVAITGRLSATNPNQQNQPSEAKQLLISRF